MSSGIKRSLSPGLPYDADGGAGGDRPNQSSSSSSSRRDKPKDWRDAFLDDDDDRRTDRREDRDVRHSSDHRRDHNRDRRDRDPRGSYHRSEHGHGQGKQHSRHDGPGTHRSSHKPHPAQQNPRHQAQKFQSYPRHNLNAQQPPTQHQNQHPRSSTPHIPAELSNPPPPTSPIPEPEPEVEPEPELSADEIIEQRRKRRQEILDKYRGLQSGAASAATTAAGVASTGEATGSTSAVPSETLLASGMTPALNTLAVPAAPNGVFDLEKADGDAPFEPQAAADISAADYDADRENEGDHAQKPIIVEAPKAVEGIKLEVEAESEEEVEVEEDDDEFDMFAALDDERPKKVIKKKVKKVAGSKPAAVAAIPLEATLVDNYDDSEGYYRITPGETIGPSGRYQVTTTLGKGMFSAVVRAKVLNPYEGEPKEVAIKIIRSQESMYIAGRKEAAILEKLMAADPEDKKHIVRMHATFEHRGHLCIVTESLSMNLRDVVKRYGKDVGLNLRAVRAYAHQMFLALSLMKKCSLVHADIKPDNILVTENKATLKVCDLGSACDADGGELTPYLVSRFYRAPEIILGLPFDAAIDIWSVGCTLYELFTGKILLAGRSNNQMLKLMMDMKGKFNHKMIKKAAFGTTHFDEGMNFVSVEKDKITGADTIKSIVIGNPVKDLRARLVPAASVQAKMKDDELKLLLSFVDLVDKCLVLDPAKRISPRDALIHPFIAG